MSRLVLDPSSVHRRWRLAPQTRARLEAVHEQAQTQRELAEAAARHRERVAQAPIWVLDEDPLDQISNRVVDLIRAKEFDEAMRLCDLLLADYPEVIDGLERSAQVHEAMGHHEEAADFYQRCLDFIERHDGFEPASSEYYENKLAEMRRLTG
jgi:tetratricopeptide (TPR) repeat protein